MKNLIVIVGPTAVGKTALAIQLAKHFRTEIVSADSRQFFREMNVGTAKPSAKELSEVRHYLINSHSIHDDYNAGRFEVDALESITHIFAQHDLAILCGGSGLYVDLVCNGADDLPLKDHKVREELLQLYQNQGIEVLQERLKALDPEYYKEVDLKNPHRLIRALEVCMVSGKKYSDLRLNTKVNRPFGIIKIGIEEDREVVYSKINSRVDQMLANQLVEEARSLFPFRHLNALNTVGYKELFDSFEGKQSLADAVAQIKQHTRNFAKRQWTWFKRDEGIKWFSPQSVEEIIQYVQSKTKTG